MRFELRMLTRMATVMALAFTAAPLLGQQPQQTWIVRMFPNASQQPLYIHVFGIVDQI